MGCRSEGSLIVDNHGTNSRCRGMSFGQYLSQDDYRIGQPITFNVLPDDVLLEIFDSYMDEDMGKNFTSPQSATCLYTRNTREGHPEKAGRLYLS